MRATVTTSIFNICTILSLFCVAIHAAVPVVRYAPRTLPECPIDWNPLAGLGPTCIPRHGQTWKAWLLFERNVQSSLSMVLVQFEIPDLNSQ